MVDDTIVVALIVGVLSVLGSVMSAKYTSNVRVVKLEMIVDELSRHVEKHNSVVERTYCLEKKVAVIEATMTQNFEC
jgi:hypothetical protein